jgi:isochorismate hydrolase
LQIQLKSLFSTVSIFSVYISCKDMHEYVACKHMVGDAVWDFQRSTHKINMLHGRYLKMHILYVILG